MAIITRKRKHKHEEDVVDLETKCRIDDLNDTLLELIFVRLSPWKYLMESKRVSKRWNSIISNPDFTRRLPPSSFAFTLFNLSKEDGGECLVTENPYFQKHNKLSLDFLPTSHPSPKIVASTNDLIVVDHHINSQKGQYYVANPLTKQYVVVPIPEPQLIDPYWWGYMVGIAGFVNGVSTVNVTHHEGNYNNNHGFRIVQGIVQNLNSINIHIYSSETDKWETYLFYYDDSPSFKRAITLNNKIHWLDRYKIVVIDPFNIDNVALRVLNLPSGIANRSTMLGVCQNRLRIAQFEKVTAQFGERRSNRENRRIKIWEIDEDYDDNVDVISGRNYHSLAKVKLIVDFELKKSFLRVGRILSELDWYDPDKDHLIICCHPNDPRVVYFTYNNNILFCCNVVEKKCRRVRRGSSNYSNVLAFMHPPLC